MKIITQQVTLDELERMAAAMFGNMVKAVVDVDESFSRLTESFIRIWKPCSSRTDRSSRACGESICIRK